METDLLNSFSITITIVSSVVAIAAVSICSILSSIFNQRGARKVKQTELLFKEMTAAYYEYLAVCTKLIDVDNPDDMLRLANAASKASLFASSKTQDLIKLCGRFAIERSKASKQGNNAAQVAEKSGEILAALIVSMQADLHK